MNSKCNSKNTHRKYSYRQVCAVILTVISTVIFAVVWYSFAQDHNITGHLLGTANLGMSIGIYAVMFVLIGRYLRAFKIGVDRKMNLIIAQVLTACIVAFLEVFISMAITGQFRLFWRLCGIYIVMAFIQSLALGIIVVPMINLYRKIFPPIQILEVYGKYKNGLCDKISGRQDKYHVAKLMNYKDGMDKIYAQLDNYDAVLINEKPGKKRNEL